MPTRTLSTLDYISIAEKRLKGLSQKQIADDLEVSVSLISKIEQTNEQYQRIYEDLLGAVVAERGRHVASAIQALERAEAVINPAVVEQAEQMRESIQNANFAVAKYTEQMLAESVNPAAVEQAEQMRESIQNANFAVAKYTKQMLAESVNPAAVEQAERIHESTQRLLAEVTDPVIAALTWRAQEAAGNLSPDELKKALPFVSKDE